MPSEFSKQSEEVEALDAVAEYVQEIYKGDGDWGIHLLRLNNQPLRVKGECPFQLRPGILVYVCGEFERSERYGKTLVASTLVPYVPDPDSNSRVFADWLRSGVVKYVGPALANRILELFGENTRSALSDVHALMQVRGIGEVLAPAIVESWNGLSGYYRLAATLHGVGLRSGEIRLILQDFWDKELRGVKHESIESFGRQLLSNPYGLTRIAGMGFRRVDGIAQRLGIPEDSVFRQDAALEFACEQIALSEGHTLFYEDWVLGAACSKDILGGGRNQWPELPGRLAALTESPDSSLISPYPEFYTREPYFQAEKAVLEFAELLSREQTMIPPEALDPIFRRYPFLTDEQKGALRALTKSRFGLLTGGPGTGKTTCIKALCEAAQSRGWTFQLLAPSGKAAARITESTGYPASTIHRFLGASTKRSIQPDVIVVDEASMVDSLLAQWLMEGMTSGQTLILVGDAHQLPSVSPGRIFGDLLDSGRYPSAELTQNHRSADIAGIPQLSGQIHRGIVPGRKDFAALARGGAHIVFPPQGDAEYAMSQLERTLNGWLASGVPVCDVQVLTPMRKGPLGTQNLNRLLRPILNPSKDSLVLGEDDFGPTEYAVGDRVIQLKNDYSVREEPIFNGDMGLVTGMANPASKHSPPAIEVTFQRAGETIRRLYDRDTIGQLTHAFAMTIHKSQGSEFPHLVMVLDSSHWFMLNRALLYTGVTRAKRELVLITQERVLRKAIETENSLRETCLYQFFEDLPPRN
jgi:exodeoxyribonuclease V alpha subunit